MSAALAPAVAPTRFPRAPLALVAGVVAVHLWLVSVPPVAVEPGAESPERTTTVQTRLIDAPATARSAEPAPRPEPPSPPTRAAVNPPPTEAAPEPPGPSASVPPPETPAAPAAPQPAASATPPAAVAAPAPAPGGAEDTAALAAAARSIPPPRHLEYEVAGESRRMRYHAQATLDWRHDGTRYAARMEVSAFLIGSRVQSSTGHLGPLGLEPERFADKSRSEQAAHFDRQRQRIVFSANTPEAALLPGAQDRLSVFMQLAALLASDPTRYRPGTRIAMQTVSAREAEPWTFVVEADETLNLAEASYATVRVVRPPRREFDARVEVWMARSLDYLPARIRITQANGDVVDQQLRHVGGAEALPR